MRKVRGRSIGRWGLPGLSARSIRKLDAPPECPALIGRAPALGMLLQASGELPSLACIEGEPGIGKTRLVTEFLGRPELSKFVKFSGTEVVIDGVLRHALEEPSASLEAGIRLARRVPTVVVMDDIDLSCDKTRSLVARFASDPPPHLCLVMTCGPDDLDRAWFLGLPGRLGAKPSLRHIELQPLTLAGVRILVHVIMGHEISYQGARRLLDRTGGVPKALMDVLRSNDDLALVTDD